MKFKSILFILCFGMLTQTFAANVHFHPSQEATATVKQNQQSPENRPQCSIRIVNNSGSNAHVTGVFTDGSRIGFNIYRNDPPHDISLFYHGYCHNSMKITISTPYDGIVYSEWTQVGEVLYVVRNLHNANQLKVDVSTK